jgi:ceramide synthetase
MAKSIPKPNPLVDGVLMLIFATELVVIGSTLLDTDREMLAYLLALIVIVAIAVAVTKLVFATVGGWFSRTFLQHLGDPLKKAVTMKKWCDQSWQLVIHVSMTIFELIVMADETWWQDTTSLWNQGTATGVFPEHKFLTKLLYITQLAIWIYTAFSCKFLEEIRKDYFVMMTHHVVTIALVTWSYRIGFLPVGVIVLLLHDLSDIPLDMLKMANYLKMEGLRGFFVSETMFVIVFAGWIYLRIYTYPTKLLYTTLVENREAAMTMEDAHDWTNLFPNPGPPSWLFFNVLLVTLYCLHIWWGLLLVRVAVGTLTKGAHETGKAEYEGASSDSEQETTKDD